MYGTGNTNGNFWYSTMIVRKSVFCLADGTDPLFNLFIGCVDLMRSVKMRLQFNTYSANLLAL